MAVMKMPMLTKSKLIIVAALIPVLSSCNTLYGVGSDLTKVGGVFAKTGDFRLRNPYSSNLVSQPVYQQQVQRTVATQQISASQVAKAKQAEQARQVALAKQAEQARQVALAKQAEQARQVALAKQAEQARQVALAKQAEQARQVALAKQAEQARQVALAKQASAARVYKARKVVAPSVVSNQKRRANSTMILNTTANSSQSQTAVNSLRGDSQRLNMTPYMIGNVKFTPMSADEAENFTEMGICSFTKTRRGKNVIGDRGNYGGLTGAHKTLPLPSTVRVTNVENGKSVVVRINNRGPFVIGRILDLSDTTRKMLSENGQGLVNVRMEVLAVGDASLEIQ